MQSRRVVLMLAILPLPAKSDTRNMLLDVDPCDLRFYKYGLCKQESLVSIKSSLALNQCHVYVLCALNGACACT